MEEGSIVDVSDKGDIECLHAIGCISMSFGQVTEKVHVGILLLLSLTIDIRP